MSRLIGVEVVPQAVEDARKNAARNGIPCAEFICGDAGFIATEIAGADNQTSEHTSGSMSSGTSCKADSKAQTSGGKAPDVIVVDPPRKGCDKATLDAVLKMSPKKLVYISCNHATAARDAAYLCSQGYKLEKYRPCDLFPRTGHVETVCLLSKLHADQHIEVELKMDELDLTVAESKATYEEIKNYVLEHSGLKVSSLYIAQVKQKCGIIERDNYNNPKSENAKHPQCSPKKEAAIRAALEHFKMI